MVRRTRAVLWTGLGVLALACAPMRTGPETPGPGEAVEPALPPIPERGGPLDLTVVYPGEGAVISARDSNFVFGTTGTGAARLSINGTPIPVEANGAFLAFLPVPADGVYRFVAEAGADTIRLDRRVRTLPPPPVLGPDSAIILRNTVYPRGAWAALPGERIEVGFRGTPGGIARLVLPNGDRIRLVEEPFMIEADEGERAFVVDPERLEPEPVAGVATYRGYFTAETLVATDTAVPLPTLVPLVPGLGSGADRGGDDASAVLPHHRGEAGVVRRDAPPARPPTGAPTAMLELVVGTDTARAPLPLNLALVDPGMPPVGMAFDAEPPARGGDGTVIGRPGPGYTYLYFWPNGTRLTLTGQREGEYRVQLTPELSAWVPAAEVRLYPAGTPPPTARVGTVRLTRAEKSVDVRVELGDRLPFLVEEGERSITLTIFGGTSDTDWLQYGPSDDLVDWAEWRQPADQVYRLILHLNRKPWGYQTLWAENGDLILRVRRPPEIDPDRPLRGLLVAVDPGHPPAGSTGPTGLREAEANLAIALRLRPLLEDAGARVLMTRTDMSPVSLQERTAMATAADADVLVSVHNNAFPDGINPFVNNGTSTYYFHRHSVDLARSLQDALLAELRLRDLGIGRANLALVRPTWMPSVLTETMYMIVPEQEAALRNPDALERIARAHLRGLEAFLRGRARDADAGPDR